MIERSSKIYTLSHPVTGNVFYVGKTNGSLKTRLAGHFTNRFFMGAANIYINNIYEQHGLRPIIEEVDTCSLDEALKLEAYWIEQFNNWGFDLYNTTNNRNKKTQERIGGKYFYINAVIKPSNYNKLKKEAKQKNTSVDELLEFIVNDYIDNDRLQKRERYIPSIGFGYGNSFKGLAILFEKSINR